MVCAVQVLSCLMKSIFSVCTLCLGSQTRLTPMGSPLSATPGASEAAYIPAVSQGGDMAQSHFQWKTTASGCRRCQMHARGVAVVMMVGGNSCIGWQNLLCLHILTGSPAMKHRSTMLATEAKDGICAHLDSGAHNHQFKRQLNWHAHWWKVLEKLQSNFLF